MTTNPDPWADPHWLEPVLQSLIDRGILVPVPPIHPTAPPPVEHIEPQEADDNADG